MKSRALIIGAVIVVVAVGGGALGVSLMEKKTEQTVRDLLAGISTSAETVDYDLFSNTLRLGTVRYTIELAGQRTDTTVDAITMEGFNPGCLDDTVSDAGIPLVAERIIATGMTGASSNGPMESTLTLGEIRLEGWHQNLGKVAALYRQEPWSEAFFAESYRSSLDMLAYKDYRVSAMAKGLPRPVVMTVGTMGSMGRIGSPDGKGDGTRTWSLFMNDGACDLAGMAAGTIRRIEVHDMLLPDAASMARLMPLIINMGRTLDTPEASKDMQETWEVLTQAYAAQAPYREIVIQDYDFQVQGESPMHLGEVKNTLAMGAPFVFGLDITGMSGNMIKMPADVRRNLEAFAPGEPLVDGSILLTLRPGGQESSVQWSADLQKLGAARGSFDVRLDVKTLGALLTLPTQQQMVAAVKLAGGEATYTDQGLTALALTTAAQNQGMTPESLLASLKEQLPYLAQSMGESGPLLEKAAAAMLDKPGVVHVSFLNPRPMDLSNTLLLMMLAPEKLDLQVTAEPGAKPLLDYIPEALKQ